MNGVQPPLHHHGSPAGPERGLLHQPGLTVLAQLLADLGEVRAAHHSHLHLLPQLLQERRHLRRDFLGSETEPSDLPEPSASIPQQPAQTRSTVRVFKCAECAPGARGTRWAPGRTRCVIGPAP